MYAKTKISIIFIILISSLVFGQEFKTLNQDGKLKESRGLLSKVITTIPKGSKVEIIYKSFEKGFYRVIYNGRDGFLHKKYLDPVSETPRKNKSAVGTIIFNEDFNNNNQHWRETKNAFKEFFFRNGQYFIIQQEDGRLTWDSKFINVDTDEDFIIDASVTLNWKQNGGAYLMFGIDENNRNYHAVHIKKEEGKKEVYFGKYIDGKWTGEWKDANLKGYGEQNWVQISKKGKTIHYFINEELIFSKPFESFFGNYIGLGCQGTQNVSFEYLRVRQDVQNFSDNKNPYNTKREITTYNYSNTVKLRKIGKVYEIPAVMNGAIDVNFVFDYDTADIIISPYVASRLLKTGTIRDEDWLDGTYYETADGTIAKSRRFKFYSLRIGNNILKDVTCTISNSIDAPMVLGHDVLSRFGKYSFNYLDETLTLD